MKIGVFDSGIGGKSVADAVRRHYPHFEVVFKNDVAHVPYGNKQLNEIYSYVLPIIKDLEQSGCEIIVVACNTVSTNLISKLRENCSVPLVALEPMVKPAALMSKTKTVAVCATPRTLESKRYQQLKHDFADGITVLEPDCSDWAYLIEHNKLNVEKISSQVDELCNKGADVIVLGCTHYHWISDEIMQATKKRASVLQPEQAVIRRLDHLLADMQISHL